MIPRTQDILGVLPELIWCGFGVFLMLLQPFLKNRQALTFFAMFGAALGTLSTFFAGNGIGFGGLVMFDTYSLFFHWLVGLVSFLVILSADSYLEREGLDSAEFYALILFATAGMGVLASAQELLTAFIGLEMSSISSYILAGYRRDSIKSSESAMKYFLLGSFATAFFLYGIALVYGVTGSTALGKLANADPSSTLLHLGLTLILVGLGFKVAAAPVPGLDTRRIRRRTHASFRALLGRAEGRRFRAALKNFCHRSCRHHLLVLGILDSCCAHHVRRKPGRGRPVQHQASAGLQLHRARRIHSRSYGFRDDANGR